MKNFHTDYKNELEILDYAISDLNVIAHLIECHNIYIDTVGTNKNMDASTACFLANAISDIANGIKETLNKITETKNHKE
ncbi:MAG: hypothetical protein LBB59_04600 [Campylobacteraceae bacterium]|jgi:hypothetical protein|nr:hypothetical protein [Campylobacteraceae bacterium]